MSVFAKGVLNLSDRLKRTMDALRIPERVGTAERWATARKRLLSDIGIWYHADYGAPGLAQSALMPNIEMRRGARIVDALEDEGLLWARDVRKGAPIPLSALSRAHSMDYLESVTEADKLAHIFGMVAEDIDVDTILKAQRRAAGGTLRASRWATDRHGRLAFNLGGGFHHAEPESGAGFCAYNDIAASIRTLRKFGYRAPIAIVDLDFHQGNGNNVTFAEDASVLTYSLHGAVWSHIEGLSDVSIHMPTGTEDVEYLETLRRTLVPALREHGPKLIYYVAGTDVLGTDALGDFKLTEDGVFQRDQFVLELAADLGASTVVTLAGGYSPEAWRSAARMVRWALTGSSDSLPTPETDGIRRQYGYIAGRLDPYELQFEDNDFEITEADLMGELEGAPKANRMLGYYSVHGVELAFERYGFLEALRQRGFKDIRFQVDPGDPDRQRVSVYGSRDHETYHLLVELLMARRSVALPELMEDDGKPLEMLSIEWLLLQDPTKTFSKSKPQLPGQEHPGLGMLRELLEMLYQACLRLDLDGLIMHPSRFHIAAVGEGKGMFLDPGIQGRFHALAEVLGTFDLSAISGMMDRNLVVHSDGSVFVWEPEDFVAPVSERLKAYLSSPEYRQACDGEQREAIQRGIMHSDELSPQ